MLFQIIMGNTARPLLPYIPGTYHPVQIVGNMVYVSGIGPLAPEATSHLAKVGKAAEDGVVDVEGGKKAARACALTMLSVLRQQLGMASG